MNMRKVIIILIFLAVGAGLIWAAFFSRTARERYIKKEIAKANYCEAASDCELAAIGECPFDCYVYANKKEAARIGKLIEDFDSRCAYMCIEFKGEIECVNNICQQECVGSQCKERN